MITLFHRRLIALQRKLKTKVARAHTISLHTKEIVVSRTLKILRAVAHQPARVSLHSAEKRRWDVCAKR